MILRVLVNFIRIAGEGYKFYDEVPQKSPDINAPMD
jgi:hypothetical protein